MKESITKKQAISIIIIYLVGTAAISGVAKQGKEDALIAVIIVALISIPIYYVYGALLNAYPGKHIFAICESVFGKAIGKIMSLVLTFNGFYLTAMLLRFIAEFVQTAGLFVTHLLSILLIIAIVCAFILKKGISVYGKWCEFFLPFILIGMLSILFLTLPIRKLENLLPVFVEGTDLLKKGIYSTLAFPFIQPALLMGILHVMEDKKDFIKMYFWGLLIASIVLVAIPYACITVIGASKYEQAYFPLYSTVRRVSIGAFIQRVELLAVLVFMVAGVGKIIATILSVAIGIQSIFSLKEYKHYITPLTFIGAALAYLAYENILERDKVGSEVYFSLSYFMNLAIPMLIYSTHLIKRYFEKVRREK